MFLQDFTIGDSIDTDFIPLDFIDILQRYPINELMNVPEFFNDTLLCK